MAYCAQQLLVALSALLCEHIQCVQVALAEYNGVPIVQKHILREYVVYVCVVQHVISPSRYIVAHMYQHTHGVYACICMYTRARTCTLGNISLHMLGYSMSGSADASTEGLSGKECRVLSRSTKNPSNSKFRGTLSTTNCVLREV
jgi:hypothetical protein